MSQHKGGILFAHSTRDLFPALCGVLHFAWPILMFLAFPVAPWWTLILMGLVYSVFISWNINSICHNFVHNPFFKSNILNRLFSFMQSIALGFSQTCYDCVHNRHHQGNSDKQDEDGDTIDWASIYRHGDMGEAENVWSYTFLSYIRDDPKLILKELYKRRRREAYWGTAEIVCFMGWFLLGFILNWKFMLFFLPFYYFGHCLSYLNGYYMHYGANPDRPLAWGVSSYNKFYNWMWFNNGFHAEHHFRPQIHWTKMPEFHELIKEEQRRAGVRVIRPPHALAFLDPDLPKRSVPLPGLDDLKPTMG
jgi:fatty acid desaturase